MVGYAGYLLSRLRRIPLVFEVADVWPDAAIAMGMLTSPLVISLSRRMEDACYHQAVKITALTRGIRDHIERKGLSAEKIILATNGVDPEVFQEVDQEKVAALRAELGLQDRFVSLYLGAHGHYNSLWTIVEAANLLRGDPHFAFVFIGDGDYKQKLLEMVERYQLNSVVFLPPVPRLDSPRYLAAGDTFLLPNRKGEFYRMNLPNKLFDFLASSRPILVAGEGETADVVLQAGAGVVVPAEDFAAMAQALRNLAGMSRIDRHNMGACGRTFAFTHYNRSIQSQNIAQVLVSAMDGN
jgi:glycosyltransferase involved in cell wall biosynthesis